MDKADRKMGTHYPTLEARDEARPLHDQVIAFILCRQA
jgi:hypothetical protein